MVHTYKYLRVPYLLPDQHELTWIVIFNLGAALPSRLAKGPGLNGRPGFLARWRSAMTY
jgi:hypothetical protein